MANIKPLGQRVLVKRIEAETKTAGGLFLPDTAKEKPQEAALFLLTSVRLSCFPYSSSAENTSSSVNPKQSAYISHVDVTTFR